MNEILVEEENTVYELDPECLRHKEEQRQLSDAEETRKKESEQYVDHLFAVTGDLPIKKRMPDQKASSFIRNH